MDSLFLLLGIICMSIWLWTKMSPDRQSELTDKAQGAKESLAKLISKK